MKRCSKCLYPETTRPFISFDGNGVCSGCRTHEEKQKINWPDREKKLHDLIEGHINSLPKDRIWDCIIPVSGGKDSHYQVWYVKKVLKLNPLLVTFNHLDNSITGVRNLENLVSKFGCDHIRFTPNPEIIRKSCKHATIKLADPFWHEHAGIYTYPVQVAVKEKIPLIIWGEYGFMDLHGMFSHADFIEMSKKLRQEHGMRGMEVEEFLEGNLEGLTPKDFQFTKYPTDSEIEAVGVRGIYLGNYLNWNPFAQTEKMIADYNFLTCEEVWQERITPNIYENAECFYNNSVHDYMKWLKFGYSRTDDHLSQLIRHKKVTRDTAAVFLNYANKKRDKSWPTERFYEFLEWIGLSVPNFFSNLQKFVDPKRDPSPIHPFHDKVFWPDYDFEDNPIRMMTFEKEFGERRFL